MQTKRQTDAAMVIGSALGGGLSVSIITGIIISLALDGGLLGYPAGFVGGAILSVLLLRK